MPLTLELTLDSRDADRVAVSVCLVPEGGPCAVEGVALDLVDPRGERLVPRLLLPIAGTLTGPICSEAVLHAAEPIPRDSRVLATAWSATDQVAASCPTELATSLLGHVLPTRNLSPDDRDTELESIVEADRKALARIIPWIGNPRAAYRARIAPEEAPGPLEAPLPEPIDLSDDGTELIPDGEAPEDAPLPEDLLLDEITDELGLDEENARWLKELLAEDDEPLEQRRLDPKPSGGKRSRRKRR